MRKQEFKLRLWFLKLREKGSISKLLLMLAACITSLWLAIYPIGFAVSEGFSKQLFTIYSLLLLFFFAVFGWKLLFNTRDFWREKGRWFELTLYLALFATLVAVFPLYWLFGASFPPYIFIWEYNILHILLVLISIIELSKLVFKLFAKPVNPGLIFALSFLVIIFVGASLLMLPKATVNGISFINALFTSTSAVCVTGLTVVDTASQFTPLGLTIIAILIQIGGIGVMTFTCALAILFLGSSSFNSRVAMRDLASDDNLNQIFRTFMYIVLVTFSIEAIGAILIYSSVHGSLGMKLYDEVMFSIFHSVSAFCNAGFSTLSGNLYDPLVRYNHQLHTWVALLIVFGGLGFPILFNYGRLISHFVRNKFRQLAGRQKMYIHAKIINTNTRLAISTTFILLIVGTLLFYLLEYNNTLKGMSAGGKLAESFFGAVTPRTAGFNSVDLSAILKPTIFLTIVLMWIGASPMSTGGGIKTTTFALMILAMRNAIRGKHHIEIDCREIAPSSMQRTSAVIVLSLCWLFISILLVSAFEPQAPLDAVIFECVSALSTVGLSLNLTSTLSDASKIVLIITMFVGRVGLITILSSLWPKFESKGYHYPKDNVMVS